MWLPREMENLKFAEYIDSIRIMYLVDHHFQMLCDQYCLSKMKAKKMEKKMEKDLYNKLENENLANELEEEILFYLIKRL